MPEAGDSALGSLCAVAQWCYGAAAVSVASVGDDALVYVAAAGAGADKIVGTHLEFGRGIAGYVAATGQSLTVRDVSSDPRFAREVGERTGYVPNEIQCVAIHGADGEVVAVLSILDRTHGEGAVPTTALTEVAAGLFASAADADDEVGHTIARLDRLPDGVRASAVTAISALLDALDR